MSDDNSNDRESEIRSPDDLDALNAIVSALRKLDAEGQRRVFDAVATFLGYRATIAQSQTIGSVTSKPSSFSDDRTTSVKEFLLAKQPKTDVHRVTCLAYYLTHYRDMPHFKTLDISKLNTEAAQPKFSNAANSVDNATKLGYLVPATKGNKQISAIGERFVQALPDYEAAKSALSSVTRRRAKRSSNKKSETETNGEA